MHKISIIIPVYNVENYLKQCLNSVLNQTFENFEIICINDCSQDNSLYILEEYSRLDNRIKIINNSNNIGSAYTRNVGIEKAQGDYIYFLDADDYIDAKYLECMAEKIETKNCNIVLNTSIVTDVNGNSSEYSHDYKRKIDTNGEFWDNITTIHNAPCMIWARMYKKSFLYKHYLRFLKTHADDVVFNSITTMYTDKTFVFKGQKYHYVINNKGMTSQAEKSNSKDLNHIKAHGIIYDYLKKRNMLNDRLKLFRVYPFIRVDTEEKFNCYKEFFERIKQDFRKNENIYNELEKYFADSLLSSDNYEEYMHNHNKIVTIGFLRNRIKAQV